ncbi:MAG: hypothetical protein HC771_08025 [Synechococcales cyanobacterium CRU_2_2]|nr:hypothetical protein [Synechococcales cyanobacterium CRU_2_2]
MPDLNSSPAIASRSNCPLQASTQGDSLWNLSAFRDDRVQGQTQSGAGTDLGLAWAIGLASASVLAVATAARWGAAAADHLGEASEALFRGDRLPLLNPPMTQSPGADLSDRQTRR